MKNFLKKLGLALIVVLVGIGLYCYWPENKYNSDIIYLGGNIITMKDSADRAEAIYVKNGKIEATGNKAEILKYQTDHTTVVDLKGKTMMPGFFDSHGHFDLATAFGSMVDISGIKYRNPADVWRIMAQEAQKSKAGQWLFFYGFDPILSKGIRTPTIQYLDSIAPNKPVVILTKALHVFYANSLAFKEMNISKNTPNPSKTSYYERDAKGELSGGIVEQAAIEPFGKKIQEIAKHQFVANTQKILDEYTAFGVTAVVNMGGGISTNKNVLSLYEHLTAEQSKPLYRLLQLIGKLPKRKPNPRVFLYFKKELDSFLPESPQNGDDFFKTLGIKFWYDGSPYAGSMYLRKPYIQSDFTKNGIFLSPNHTSHSIFQPAELQQYIEKYQAKGWQVAIHAQGDIANEEVLGVFRNLHKKSPINRFRHRVEHCMLLPKESANAMKMMSISPSFHINHLLYYGEFLGSDVIGKERANLIFPIRSVASTGLPYTLHADMPQFIPNPLSLASTSVNRTTQDGLLINANERVSVWQAMKSITIDAAWQLHLEQKLGSIEKGKYADLVILDQDPLTINPADLSKIKVLETLVAGNTVWKF
jgi:predicted amidohydrolase YtcJ